MRQVKRFDVVITVPERTSTTGEATLISKVILAYSDDDLARWVNSYMSATENHVLVLGEAE